MPLGEYATTGAGKDSASASYAGVTLADMRNYVPFSRGRLIELPFMGGKLYEQLERITVPGGEAWVDVIKEFAEVGDKPETFAMKVYPNTQIGTKKYFFAYSTQKEIYSTLCGVGGNPNVLQFGSCYYDPTLHVDGAEGSGAVVYVLEFVDSRMHAGHVTFQRGYHFDEALEATCSIARLLSTTDLFNIAHRDIKPQNILMPADVVSGNVKKIYPKRAKLFDYDMAWFPAVAVAEGFDVSDFAGAIVGTPGYMSPEAIRGKEEAFLPLVDRYSLGMTALTFLTNNNNPWGLKPEATPMQRIFYASNVFSKQGMPSGVEKLAEIDNKRLRDGTREMIEGLLAVDGMKRWEADRVVVRCDELLEYSQTLADSALDVEGINAKMQAEGDLPRTMFIDRDEARTIPIY